MARELDRILRNRKDRLVKKHGGQSAVQAAMARRRATMEGDPEAREPEALDDKGRLPTEGEHTDAMVELGNEFSQRAKREADRVDDAIEGDFYAVVYFQTSDQVKEFLDKSGWLELADRVEGDEKRFYDGMEIARLMNIEMVSPTPPTQGGKKVNKKWAALAQTITEDYADDEETADGV